MKNISKKFLAFALIMTMGLAGVVIAASGAVAYTPADNKQLWWQNWNAIDDFNDPYQLTLPNPANPGLDIVYNFGYNTIEEYEFNDDDDYFYLVIHPQYLPEVDQPASADYAVAITSLKVKNASGVYEECLDGGIAKIPGSYMKYMQENPDIAPYLPCEIDIFILGVSTDYKETITAIDLYLEVPDGVLNPPSI